MHEAKSQLSKLGEKAWAGENVVITKSGKPHLDLLPHKEDHEPREPEVKNSHYVTAVNRR
jgi:antitoxin (DNA-binding transcriptional repressor) of toxin-antitoxin stability system